MNIAYLTFDDGPLLGTSEIIKIFNERKICGSMLMVGQHVEKSAQNKSWLEMAKASSCIMVGNHSYSHANSRYSAYYTDPQAVLKDFEKNQEILGISKKIARLPGRNMWQVGKRSKYDIASGQSSAQLLHRSGYVVFGWDIEWQHDASGNPIETVDKILNNMNLLLRDSRTFTPGHIVVLAHDQMFRKADADSKLIDLLSRLSDSGYTLKTLEEYPEAELLL